MKTVDGRRGEASQGMWLLLTLVLAAAAVHADCPRHCECKWRSGKESALCARAGLTSVPPRLDPTTQLLDLAENRLPTLRDDAFAAAGLLNLQRLYLSSCTVRTIRQYAFRALVNLVELDLSRNRLEAIPSHAFDTITELRELRLASNPIVRIKDESFIALPHLVKLSLSTCKVSEVGPRAFIGLEGSLEYLELDKNRLQVLHVAVLAPLRSLKGLELASNPWECTCALKPMRDWMIKKNVPATVVPECALPPRLVSQSWDRLDLEDFACEPEVNAESNSFKGLEGDQVTLACHVLGVSASRVRWTRAGRLLANSSSTSGNSGKTFLLRSDGQTSYLIIKSVDLQDAGFYTCNAENRAGKAETAVNLVIEKKPTGRSFGGRALMAGMAISAVIVLSLCLIGLFAYETRKKRQVDRWNEQIVTSNRRDDSYEKIESSFKSVAEPARLNPINLDNNRKRGDYRNVPSHDPEDDGVGYVREEVREGRESPLTPPPLAVSWQRANYNNRNSGPGISKRDLHIPRINDYTMRTDDPQESVASSHSTEGVGHSEIYIKSNRYNNNAGVRPRAKPRERLDNDLSGSDSEKNYPDLLEMSALGGSSYLKSEIKHDPYYFYTMPRRKEGESRSPLLCSRRNSSGGDSGIIFEKPYDKTKPKGRRSNSFLDLSSSGNRYSRNPSLPTSPSRGPPVVPSATPLLDLSGLRDYSRLEQQPIEDYDFRASQLEKFLEEYRSLRDQLSKMKETREHLQRSRAVDGEEYRSIMKGKPSIAVTQTSSSVALADAASPLAMSPPEYKAQQPPPDWLTTLLYRN